MRKHRHFLSLVALAIAPLFFGNSPAEAAPLGGIHKAVHSGDITRQSAINKIGFLKKHRYGSRTKRFNRLGRFGGFRKFGLSRYAHGRVHGFRSKRFGLGIHRGFGSHKFSRRGLSRRGFH